MYHFIIFILYKLIYFVYGSTYINNNKTKSLILFLVVNFSYFYPGSHVYIYYVDSVIRFPTHTIDEAKLASVCLQKKLNS